MAPLVKELESRAEIESICCITAQHREMLDDVLRLFRITPWTRTRSGFSREKTCSSPSRHLLVMVYRLCWACIMSRS